MTKKLNNFLFLLFLFIFFIFNLNSLAEIEENSNILEIRTYPLNSSYEIFCNHPSYNSIEINIGGQAYEEHRLILSYTLQGEIWGGDYTILTSTQVLPANQSIKLKYLHNNLTLGVNYTYKLKVDYLDSNLTDEEKTISCKTGSLSFLPLPSDFKIYSVSNNSLHLTWKDNVTSTNKYGFCLKRIRLTPFKPIDVQLNQINKIISWKNLSNNNNEKIGPFYHEIQFSKDNTFNDNDEIVGGNGEIGSSTNSNDNNINFSFNYSNIGSFNKARIRACSFQLLDINFDSKEDLICSEWVEFDYNIQNQPNSSQSYKTKNNFFANVLEILNNLLLEIKKYYQKIVEKIKAQEIVDVSSYFNSNKIVDLTNLLPNKGLLGVYQDKGLIPDIVYYYRLNVAEEVNGVLNCNSSNIYLYNGAKTTKNINNLKQINLCVQNSLCKSFNGGEDYSEGLLRDQCKVNSDCRNVGSSRRIYQEINR